MADLVRVRLNGFEKNVGRTFAETTKGVEILDEPTHRPDGTAIAMTRAGGRPVKPRKSVDQKAAEKPSEKPTKVESD